MREILTALAVLLIVLLTAALAGPYFIDWNSQRSFVEARLSHALGQKVTIGGAIDLKLLPTPYLVLDQAVIGDDEDSVTIGIRHLDLELSVTPLLHGEFDIVDARLEEPTIRITLQRDRSLPALPPAPAFSADVRFDAIAIVDGTLALADPTSGRTLVLDHLDFDAEVESLRGPFKGSGAAGPKNARTKFRFAAGAAQNGATRTKLVVEETGDHAGFEADGTVSFSGAQKAQGRQAFDGTAAVFGHLADHGTPLLPWRLSGAIHADPLHATMSAGELRLGLETHGLILSADGTGDFGQTPTLALTLAGKQLDVDRLFGVDSPESAPGAAPISTLPDFAVLRQALAGSAPVLPVTTTFTIDTATLAGETLGNLRGTFAFGAAGAAPFALDAEGPGQSHVALDGQLAPDASFRGQVAIGARDAPAAFDWLGHIAPGLAVTRQTAPFRAIEATGQVSLGPLTGEGAPRLEAKGLALRFDRSSLTGTALFTPADGAHPASLKADMQAGALDIDTLPDLGLLRHAATSTDLDLRLDAHAVKVARVGDGPLDAGRIRFALARTGSRMALSGFRIEGLGGAAIDAAATLDPDGGTIEARLDAGKLVDAAALLRRVVPGAWSEAFVARASALAPAKIAVSAILKPLDASGATSPKAMHVEGTLGATAVQASLAPDPANPANVVIKATANAPEGSVLLRQIGLSTLPLNTLGASRATLEARGPLDGALDTGVRAILGASVLDLAGHMTVAADKRGGSGTVKLASPDISPLLQTLAFAFPDMAGRIPVEAAGGLAWTAAGVSFADLKGRIAGVGTSGSLAWHTEAKSDPVLTGALHLERLSLATVLSLSLGPAAAPSGGAFWSSLAFGTGLVDPPRTQLALETPLLDLGQGLLGHGAALTLEIAPGLTALKAARATLDGGEIRADLTIRRDGPTVALDGKLALAQVGLDLPGAKGALSARLDLAGSGRSPLALVASLSGSGEAAIADLKVPHADPAALPAVFAEVEADRLSVDEDTLVRALDEAGRNPWTAGSQAFALSLAAGVAHVDRKPGEAVGPMPVTTILSASLDLRKLAIEERIEQTLHQLPKNWSGPPPRVVLTLAGPLKAPNRTADISAFINALATRALARESARIEAYEFDVHERAFFNQRLQSDRRHEQERVKAEEDARLAAEAARKAEADRRAIEIAAKLDQARKAEEAKLARDKADKAALDRAAQVKAQQDRARDEQARARADQQRLQDTEPRDPPEPRRAEPPTRQSDPSPNGLY